PRRTVGVGRGHAAAAPHRTSPWRDGAHPAEDEQDREDHGRRDQDPDPSSASPARSRGAAAPGHEAPGSPVLPESGRSHGAPQRVPAAGERDPARGPDRDRAPGRGGQAAAAEGRHAQRRTTRRPEQSGSGVRGATRQSRGGRRPQRGSRRPERRGRGGPQPATGPAEIRGTAESDRDAGAAHGQRLRGPVPAALLRHGLLLLLQARDRLPGGARLPHAGSGGDHQGHARDTAGAEQRQVPRPRAHAEAGERGPIQGPLRARTVARREKGAGQLRRPKPQHSRHAPGAKHHAAPDPRQSDLLRHAALRDLLA
ncbi:unnamed protein product, partial [Symbiodinium pilosum]